MQGLLRLGQFGGAFDDPLFERFIGGAYRLEQLSLLDGEGGAGGQRGHQPFVTEVEATRFGMSEEESTQHRSVAGDHRDGQVAAY